MERAPRWLGWLLLSSVGVLACAGESMGIERRAALAAALESITSEELKGHVDYLADDTLAGREAGSQGGRAAAEYLATRLREIGLRGAGADGDYFQPFEPGYRNVLGMVEGSDPELKRQWIVVGAHYDHLGLGTKQNSRGPLGEIHNGADDNASGDSALLELAEALTLLAPAPKRSVLIALWDAEEKGLLGSKHWTSHPTLPLEQVAAVVNVDMVGRLRDDRLHVFGTRTGYGFRRLVSQSNEGVGLALDFTWDFKPNGDHWPFFEHRIPVLMLHTGLHDEYHRPSDDAQLINVPGMRRVVRLLLTITYDLADGERVPAYREAGRQEKDSSRTALLEQKPPLPERLGIGWEKVPSHGRGAVVTSVTAGSPAERAGLARGDRIVELAGRPIRSDDELIWSVMSAQGPVSILVERPGQSEPIELAAKLQGQPMRLGIHWQPDDAEPGAVVLTQVVPGSPAAQAGLKAGDYIYQIAGRDFASEHEFGELAQSLPGPIRLLVEREGRLMTVEIHLAPQPLRRAA